MNLDPPSVPAAPEKLRSPFPRRFGKYRLLAPLAQGGMGALYLAVTGAHGLEKLCVVKTVLPHMADTDYVARFRDEAKVVVRLSHGNLVPVFDAGQVGGELYLAMDFVEGKDLRAVWNRCAARAVAFPVDIAVLIVKELCRGLHYAHASGDLRLVHRDVSPPNLLVSFAGEVKLTDFGLATSTIKTEKTAPGVIYGKVSYMSPEQARGEPLDGRTDLYAAGIILWELLTGRQLFPVSGGAGDPGTDLVARAKDPMPEPPSRRAARVPPELDAIVLRALDPQPSRRYQTGEEFRAVLAGWLAREAPTTDGARLSGFVGGLFADDVLSERRACAALVAQSAGLGEDAGPAPARRVALEEVARVATGHAPASRTLLGIAVPPPPIAARGTERPTGPVALVRPGGAPLPRAPFAAPVRTEEEPPDFALLQFESAASSGPTIDPLLGQIVDGRYRVLSLLGEGGMGRVYAAEHVEIGRRVAIKVLHPVFSGAVEVVERFRREARAASRIGNPHIVDVTDSGMTGDGSVYFVMEQLDGEELAVVIRRDGPLPVDRALHVAMQICRAVAAAHEAGIIHRDLKPENIFLVSRGGTTDFVKVLDFGIATSVEERREQRLTHPGTAMGTPEYMAPEQAAGRPADVRTDVYAAGAILYEMLSGVSPYEGRNFLEILTKKATVDPRPLRELGLDVPELLEAVVLRALARSPSARPRSMEALEYELARCLGGRVAQAAPSLPFAVPRADTTPLDGGSARAVARPAPSVRSSSVDVSFEASEKVLRLPERRVDTDRTARPVFPEESEPHLPPRRRGAVWIVAVLAAGAVIGAGMALVAPSGVAKSDAPGPQEAVSPPVELAGAPSPVAVREPPAPAAVVRAPRVVPAPFAARPERRVLESKPAPTVRKATPEAPKRIARVEPARPAPAESSLAMVDGTPRDEQEAGVLLGQARAAEARGAWASAKSVYLRVVRGAHSRADGLIGLASVAFQNGDFAVAAARAREAVTAGGGDAARMLLGHTYFKQGRWDEARATYRAILTRNPDNKEALAAVRAVEQRAGGTP